MTGAERYPAMYREGGADGKWTNLDAATATPRPTATPVPEYASLRVASGSIRVDESTTVTAYAMSEGLRFRWVVIGNIS